MRRVRVFGIGLVAAAGMVLAGAGIAGAGPEKGVELTPAEPSTTVIKNPGTNTGSAVIDLLLGLVE